MQTPINVTILGSRGSVPVCGSSFSRYGGATCCILLRYDNQALLLDAGTGILDLPRCLREQRTVSVFMTHTHIDHILGLPICPAVLDPKYKFHIYGMTRNGLGIEAQFAALISPPLWPICAEQLPAHIQFHELAPDTVDGAFSIRTMEGNHPGGVSVLRVTAGNRSIVLMTDCTITEENRPALQEFCRDCDLLLCDGQYTEEEWFSRASFGHNTQTMAARFGLDCGAKCVRILHHDPCRTDEDLDKARLQVQSIHPLCNFAYDGEELTV